MITVVTGLPRSGTSLMMQILNTGGMQILSDNLRNADINNPKGYFEFEKVKSLQKDNSWIQEADGKVIKIIAQLVQYLPLNFDYNIIVMERNPDEIILSQDKMIENLGGKKAVIDKEILKKTFTQQLDKALKYLSKHSNFKVVRINYNELLSGNLKLLEELNTRLGLNINIDKAGLCIDNSLYRNRVV